jgi:sugar phosphate isomerase/epimerase
MRVLLAKSGWEAPGLTLPELLGRIADAGFDAAELYLPGRPESPAEIARLCATAGLKLVLQIATDGRTVDAHAASLESLYARACEAGPLLVNAQTGRDHFAFADSVRLFERARALETAAGVPLLHETHRGRALFTAPATAEYLKAVPGLRLTADLSHWFCVHESDLADQPESVAAAIEAADHVHARVGFPEGPQVGDPRGEAFSPWLDLHMALWRRIVAARKRDGRAFLTITPEFGPAPYMPVRPLENEPVADAWAVNVWMRDRLALEFGRDV